MNKKISIILFISLFISSINCIAVDITTNIPHKRSAFKFSHNYKSISSRGTIEEYENYGEFTIKKTINNHPLDDLINTLSISPVYNNVIIDTHNFDSVQGGTYGNKRYEKAFNIDGKTGNIVYTLNVKFETDKKNRKILKSIEAKILKISINGIELTKTEL